jgi:predicted cobalt transporter CbtA
MVWALLRRGLAVGAAAGLLAGGFGLVAGEPNIERAIAIEQRHAGGHVHPAARDRERAGLVLATTLYGLCIGGVFACAFAVVRGRVRSASDARLALGLAGALFVAVVLVPFLKYPPNPPGVGDPDTIGARTTAYLVLLLAGLLSLVAALRAARSVRGRAVPWTAAATFAGPVALMMATLPPAQAIPPDVPAGLLWDFRVASLGTQVVLWAALGAGFATLVQRRRYTEAT